FRRVLFRSFGPIAPDDLLFRAAPAALPGFQIEFGKRIYLEAWKRGWSRAEKKVVMGDGAEWIWNLAEQHFPGALGIVDLYHARQHLWELARKLHPNDEVKQKAWIRVHQRCLLDQAKIE